MGKIFETNFILYANSGLRERFSFCISVIFWEYWQNLHFGRATGLGYNFMKSCHLLNISKSSKIFSVKSMCQFITNNEASLHLWWKTNLVKYQKVSYYYDHDLSWCIQIFLGRLVDTSNPRRYRHDWEQVEKFQKLCPQML